MKKILKILLLNCTKKKKLTIIVVISRIIFHILEEIILKIDHA